MMNWRVIVFLVFLPLLSLVFIIAFWVSKHRRLKPYYAALEALKIRFQGRISKLQKYLLHNPCFIGSFSGVRFSIIYFAAGRTIWVYGLELACKFKPTGKLKIFMYEKNPGPVFLAKRIKPGDHDFDKYFIFSNMPEEAMRYFADNSRKDNIRELLAKGWRLPAITGRKINTCAADQMPKPQLDPALVESALKNLLALRPEVPDNSG